jgi:hypothetical protein
MPRALPARSHGGGTARVDEPVAPAMTREKLWQMGPARRKPAGSQPP